jgi:phosphonate transport system ATP-binding protein
MQTTLEAVSAAHPAARNGAQPAVRCLSLSVARGEQVAVIGPSGAGKTTLLHVLACSLKPAGGVVMLNGVQPWSLSTSALQKLRAKLFLAPQTPPLPPRQRVVTTLMAARLPGMGLWESVKSLIYPADIAASHAALQRFDLADKLFERVDRLSGGERQRVGLARALLSRAELWLVDEPLSALDPTRAHKAIQTLTTTARERGVTLVTTLHQVDAALENFPRIIGLRDGELAFDLPAVQVNQALLQDLYRQREHELTGPAPEPEATDAPAAVPTVIACR